LTTKHLRDEIVPLSMLKPHPKNPRRHSPDYIKRIERSINAFDKTNPIIVTPDYTIIAGHARLIAAQQLGLTDFPVRIFDFTKEEAEAYMIADNKLAEGSEWIDSILVDLFSELELKQFDLELTGYDTSEISSLRYAAGEPIEEDFDVDAALSEVEGRAIRGDVWQLGKHRLMCGDCTTISAVNNLINGEKIGMILTDPPYCSGGFQEAGKASGSVGTRGTEMVANDTLSTRGYQALMKQALSACQCGICYIFTDWRMWINLFDLVESCGFGVRNMIVWDKGTPGMGAGWRMQHELIMCAIKVKSPFNPKKAVGNVIQCKRTGNINHPTEKPVELLAKVIDVTDMVRTVYDPFCGSGSTLIACEQTGRTCYMMEIDPHYCDVILKRWEDYTGNTAEVITRQADDLQN